MIDERVEVRVIEALLIELKRDERMVSLLKKSGLRNAANSPMNAEAKRIVDEWLDLIEFDLGHGVSLSIRTQANRFAARKLPILLRRFRGNHEAVVQTIFNMLDGKFNTQQRMETW
jgi:hypothetical protein